jgi:hypothetical protein
VARRYQITDKTLLYRETRCFGRFRTIKRRGRTVLAESHKKTETGSDSSGDLGGYMSRYKEFEKREKEKREENKAIVSEVVQVLKNHSLCVKRIHDILDMTKEEVNNQAHLS